MSDFQKQYKAAAFGFGSTNENRLLRVEKHEKSRKNRRAKTFNENRNLQSQVADQKLSDAREDRTTRLIKWKADRDKQKRAEKSKKKPAFVVGVVHHKVYSPANKDEVANATTIHKRPCTQNTQAVTTCPVKRITRATEKRLKKKALEEAKPKPQAKNINSNVNHKEKEVKKRELSFAPANYKFKAPIGLTQIPIFGRVMIESLSPAKISEYMSTSMKYRRSMKSDNAGFMVEDITNKKEDMSLSKNRRSSYVIQHGSTVKTPKKDNVSENEYKTRVNSSNTEESFRNNAFKRNNVSVNKNKTRNSSNRKQNLTKDGSKANNDVSLSEQRMRRTSSVMNETFTNTISNEDDELKHNKIKMDSDIEQNVTESSPKKKDVSSNERRMRRSSSAMNETFTNTASDENDELNGSKTGKASSDTEQNVTESVSKKNDVSLNARKTRRSSTAMNETFTNTASDENDEFNGSKTGKASSDTEQNVTESVSKKNDVSLNARRARRNSTAMEQSSTDTDSENTFVSLSNSQTKTSSSVMEHSLATAVSNENISLNGARTRRNSIVIEQSPETEKTNVSLNEHRTRRNSSDRKRNSILPLSTKSSLSVAESKMNQSDLEDSSVESLALKLSSDEELLNASNIKNNNDESITKKDLKNNDSFNNSMPKILSSSNNVSLQSNSSSEPAFFSPYVVSSRGKNNARKEQKLRRGFSLGCSPSNDIPTKDTIMKNLNISVEEEERTAQYFQFLLNKEIERLNELCEKWAEIMANPEITEDAQYQINQAIGQTNLLISKKFERFRGLVSDCESGKGEMLVTCKDLQGFWDMMYMEVKNCESRFEKLEQLRAYGWKEETQSFVKLVKKKAGAKKKILPTKSSSIRAFMAEKKKMLQEGKNNTEVEIITKQVPNTKFKKNEFMNSPMKQKSRSMSVGPNDIKSTPSKQDGARFSLLQKVQLSEASKKMKSPLTIMKISQMCKTPEVHLDDRIAYVNSDQTPGKSILKQPKQLDSSVKSTNKVNFNDEVVLNEVPVNEEVKTKNDLAAALARIDSFDMDSMYEDLSINAERKLNFDDDSSEESEKAWNASSSKLDDSIENNKIKPFSIRLQSTPLKELKSNTSPETSRPKKSLRRQNAMDGNTEATRNRNCVSSADISLLKQKLQDDVTISDKETSKDFNESVRTLRNRNITLMQTPKNRRSLKRDPRGVQELEHKENKTPTKMRRRSSVKVTIKDSEDSISKMDLQEGIMKMSLESHTEKRRTRRSVKFTDCHGCIENKPTLPMTPHVRRSKSKHSTDKKQRSVLDDSTLIPQTQAKTPERITRRSQVRKGQSTSSNLNV